MGLRRFARAWWLAGTVCISSMPNLVVIAATPVAVGRGSYLVGLPPGAPGPTNRMERTARVKGPMPSNDWWTSLAWPGDPLPVFPHPLAMMPERDGLRIAFPGAHLKADEKGIFGPMPGAGLDLVLGHSAVEVFPRPQVDGYSDWFVDLLLATNQASIRVSFGHGSPFVYAVYAGGEPVVRFKEAPRIWSGDANASALGISVNGVPYGLFGPSGSRWNGQGSAQLGCATGGRDYFSVAVLPDAEVATLRRFEGVAHQHVVGTTVSWHYDPASGDVTTRFLCEIVAREGSGTNTLMALYPHQWRQTSDELLPAAYASVRGSMRLREGKGFTTRGRFPGVLNVLPAGGATAKARVTEMIRRDMGRPESGAGDTYWQGKMMGRSATLAAIAGELELSEEKEWRGRTQTRLEAWLEAGDGKSPGTGHGRFAYETNWGTLIGYPGSYGTDRDLNDHHFHYGYFIRAAAEVARKVPAWAAADRWGGMIRLLIRDIASPDRKDPLFPFLRCFDPYAGHSWASGHGRFPDGNNNESSSEAMNAWTGLILWGEVTGDRDLRDLGVWLYTTEMGAIQEYWFDVHDTNHPAGYAPSVVTMIWGSKGANTTWFSADPQLIHGINWLPFQGGSLYLGHDPAYALKNYQALLAERRGSDRWNNWPDLIWMYRALSDPADALRQISLAPPTTKLEDGNSWGNAMHWILGVQELGSPDSQIAADYPVAAVFRKGSTQTYVGQNLTDHPRRVRFTDGTELTLGPHETQRRARNNGG